MPDRWRREVINPNIEQTLQDLLQTPTLSDFYLAGGTGLALHLGHRRSVDLDFFSAEKWDQEVLLQKIQHLPRFSVVAKAEQTLHVEVRDTKISFFGYSYRVLFPFATFLGVKIADPRGHRLHEAQRDRRARGEARLCRPLRHGQALWAKTSAGLVSTEVRAG